MKKNRFLILNIKIFFIIILCNIVCLLFYINKYAINKIFGINDKKIYNKLELADTIIKIYSELYDYMRKGYLKPKFLKHDYNHSSKQKTSNICICSIGKNENLYVREFVEYYFNLGIDKIFLYDNNDINGEKFENVLMDFIQNNFVEIIDVRGLSSIQIPIYNYCYRKYNKFYDWIGFLDFDEFLFIENNKTIKNYIYDEKFNKCQMIFFNWILYNDNDQVKYENRSLLERFSKPTMNYTQGKSFVRGKLDNLIIPSSHIPGINIYNFCNSNGDIIYPSNFFGNKFEKDPKAFIKHFYTKTAEEFCNKINKGHAHFHRNHSDYKRSIKNRINLFFSLNKKTKEKVNILEKCLITKIN